MEWQGSKLRDLISSKGVTQVKLATELNVSRQTVADWMKGQVPKGTHLLQLCQMLDISPDQLFSERRSPMSAAPHQLASEYATVLNAEEMPVLVPVVQGTDRRSTSRLAKEMRQLVDLGHSASPMGYKDVFTLMDKLGLCVIFHRFPNTIQSDAFYTIVNGQRVIFVNSNTNVLDLVFPVLHEAVHALRNHEPVGEWEQAEEDFCDAVAGLTQFPDAYVEDVCTAVKGRHKDAKINTLKDYAKRHHHTIDGIVKRIEEKSGSTASLDIHGADANLRQGYPTIGEILVSENASTFVSLLEQLSPTWLKIISRYAESMTTGRLAELLDLESVLDARSVKEELLAWRKRELNGRSM